MVKHTQTIRRQIGEELFECDHFKKLALKGLNNAMRNPCINSWAEQKNSISRIAEMWLR